MVKWVYKNKKYTISSIPLEDDVKLVANIINQRRVVYNTKWDKCYYINNIGYTGKGNKLKACIEDVYTKKKCCTCLKDLKLVIEEK